MATFSYFLLRLSAIALGLGCTVWSAWQSWVHTPWDFTGPLAAVAAALMFIYAEHALRDRQKLHLLSLGVLGVLAAIISGSVVLQRNAHAQAGRVQAAQSQNLPKLEAAKALATEETALKAASAAASAECADSGRSPSCRALELREKAARQRVDDARTKLAGLGAHAAENPTTAVLGDFAGTFQRAMAVAPAIWLELAAPALLAFGFAPWPRKVPMPKRKAKRRGRRASKPAPPAQAKRMHGANLKLVAANDA